MQNILPDKARETATLAFKGNNVRKHKKLRGGAHMPYKITTDCISCGACEPECPTSCISMGDSIYEINANECIDCGACADVCPVDAPIPE